MAEMKGCTRTSPVFKAPNAECRKDDCSHNVRREGCIAMCYRSSAHRSDCRASGYYALVHCISFCGPVTGGVNFSCWPVSLWVCDITARFFHSRSITVLHTLSRIATIDWTLLLARLLLINAETVLIYSGHVFRQEDSFLYQIIRR